MGSFVLKLRRGDTPFYRRLRQLAHNVRSSNLPLPRFFNPVLRGGFHLYHNVELAIRWSLAYFIFEPLFRGPLRVGWQTFPLYAHALGGGTL